MSLVTYTPFQRSIINAAEAAEGSAKLLRADLEAFQDRLAKAYYVHTQGYFTHHTYSVWETELSATASGATARVSKLALRLAPFPHATPEQHEEALRLLGVPAYAYLNAPNLPDGIQTIINEYAGVTTISELGDITRAQFDLLTHDGVLLSHLREDRHMQDEQRLADMHLKSPSELPLEKNPAEIIRCVFNAYDRSAQQRVEKIPKGKMLELAASICPERTFVDTLKIEMLLANLKAYNESFKPSSVKIEEITPDG